MRTQGRRAGLDAHVGGALRDGRARLPGRSTRATSPRPSGPGSSTRRSWSAPRSASRSRATRRFVQANPRFEAMFGWARRRAGRQAAARRSGPAMPTTRSRPHGRPAAVARGKRSSSSARCGAATAACSGAACSRRWSTRSHPAGGTIWIADDVTERRRLDAGAGVGARRRRGREPRQERVPGQHQPRDPHPAQRPARAGAAGAAAPTSATDRREHYLSQIVESAQSLAVILSDILDLSKIEAGKIALEDIAVRPARAADRRWCTSRTARWPRARASTLELDDRRRRCPTRVDGRPGAGAPDPRPTSSPTRSSSPSAAASRVEATTAGPGAIRLAVTDTGTGIDARDAAAPVPAVLAGRRLDDAALRRHRPRPVDLPRAGRA